MQKLRSFLQAITASKGKFFTVVQYDDGILAEKFMGKYNDLRIFSAGGYGSDPIPLTCDPHPTQNRDKKYLASFLGSVGTHLIRQKMMDNLMGEKHIVLKDVYTKKEEVENYRRVTEESYFVLCPRGYGKTSFRLYEVMQMGAVPVYIADEHWLPFQQYLDWKQFCIVTTPDRIDELPGLMRGIIECGEYEPMRNKAIEVYKNYFCYDSCFRTIERILKEENV
jgi:hypothetical protein